jgi:hypothetical protein
MAAAPAAHPVYQASSGTPAYQTATQGSMPAGTGSSGMVSPVGANRMPDGYGSR